MTPASPSVPARVWAILVVAAVSLLGLSTPPAHAAGGVAAYVVNGSIARDGLLSVDATLTLEGAPAEVRQRFATTLNAGRDRQYRFQLSDVTATAGGRAVTPTVTTDGDYQVITIPTSGADEVTLSYDVRGAAFDNGDGTTTVRWRLLQGLSLPVGTFDATIQVPGNFTMIDCSAGSPAAPGACANYTGGTHETQNPMFSDGPRGAGEVVEVAARFDDAVVSANQDAHRIWTLDHAFSASPVPLGAALGLAALGALALFLLHRKVGRDASGAAAPTMLGGFHPVGQGQSEFRVDADVRPGLVGTLVDERVDPVDVTASILDLAVRGHLLIEELPRTPGFKPTQWQISGRTGGDELRPFERTLLDAVAPGGGEPRLLSQIATPVTSSVAAVQSELYDDVVEHGWFSRRPDDTRSTWARLGLGVLIAAVLVAGLLIAFTQFGLLAPVLVALAAGLLFLGQAMPARTADGASVLAGLDVLRGQLLTQPTDEMPRGREYAELSEVLPYAVVLGGVDRWLDGLVAADGDDTADARDLPWYYGPADWHLSDLPDSLRNFITSLEGELFKR